MSKGPRRAPVAKALSRRAKAPSTQPSRKPSTFPQRWTSGQARRVSGHRHADAPHTAIRPPPVRHEHILDNQKVVLLPLEDNGVVPAGLLDCANVLVCDCPAVPKGRVVGQVLSLSP